MPGDGQKNAPQQKAKASKNYEEFGLLAEKVSEDDWRVMMGDHKSIHRGRMPAPVEKAVFSMKAGEVSEVIDTGDSLCIARVNARKKQNSCHSRRFGQV